MLAISAGVAFAQPSPEKKPKTPEERAAIMKEKMTSSLALSEEQASRIEGLMLEAFTELEAVRSEMEVLRQKRKELRDKMNDQLNGILTPEQAQKFETIKEQKKAERKARKIERIQRKE